MKKALLLLLLLPRLAFAQAVSRSPQAPEQAIMFAYIGGALVAGAVNYNGTVLPARGVTITAITMYLNGGGGGGAGTSVLRVVDGSANTCTFTLNCSATTSAGTQRVVGTGVCSFAPSSSLTFSQLSSTCTTTQPSVKGVQVFGKWN